MNPTKEQQALLRSLGFLAFAFAFFFFTMKLYNWSQEEPKPAPPAPQTYDAQKPTATSSNDSLARVCAKQEIEKMLIAPSTADFPWLISATQIDDKNYVVRSYVDAENAYGAKLRQNFLCYVVITGMDVCETECAFE